jgi:hypothetical protein
MKISTYRATFAISAIAIASVAMLRDPDTANADEIDATPTPDRMPGYYSVANLPKYEPLSASELARLNAQAPEPVATF